MDRILAFAAPPSRLGTVTGQILSGLVFCWAVQPEVLALNPKLCSLKPENYINPSFCLRAEL